MSHSLDRLVYVDDSGHPQSGLAVYGWIAFAPGDWAGILSIWLDTRKRLWREFGIPVVRELHTTEFVNGRGRLTKRVPERHVHDGIEHWKDFGREVAVECLDTLRCAEGLTVGAVWRRGEPRQLARTRQQLYAALISRWEGELDDAGGLALVFMDGDGSDTSYRSTHRSLSLARRRVIEDAVHLESRVSQLVQMADLVAWCAQAHVDRHEKNRFAWEWYSGYLAERDPQRAPLELRAQRELGA